MKHLFFLCKVLVFSFYLGLAIYPASANAAEDISKQIQGVLRKYGVDASQIGIYVGSDKASGNKTTDAASLFELNSKKKFIPASVTKIFTSYAVLQRLPMNHKFKTELYYDGSNLYIKGGGDPSFVSENMWFLVNEFVRQDIKKIKDIVVDDSLFDKVRYDESRESVRVDRSYDAPVGAMSFNWNSVNIYVKPTKAGEKAQVYLDPESTYFQLVNNTKTAPRIAKELIIDVKQSQRQIVVTGDVLSSALEKPYYKNVSDPILWTGENLKAFLQQRDIAISGKVRDGVAPASANLVGVSESKSLMAILSDMNKFSNNYVAEMLTKNLAVFENEKPATLKTGMKVIREELKKIGLDSNSVEIENPSGFSRGNKITAQSLARVLSEIKQNFKIFPSFAESLPMAGLDGTLKRRMKNTKAEGFIRAKTGYLDGVITLAGYIGKSNGEILTFTFLYNGPRDMKIIHETFDQILLLLLE